MGHLTHMASGIYMPGSSLAAGLTGNSPFLPCWIGASMPTIRSSFPPMWHEVGSSYTKRLPTFPPPRLLCLLMLCWDCSCLPLLFVVIYPRLCWWVSSYWQPPMAIGTTQMADIPLAYYYLAFTTALYYYLQKAEKKYLALAGLMVGFAGWTKNDGLILIAACIVVYVLWLLVHKSPVSEIKKGLPWLVGIAVPMGAILYFKFFLAPANDFMVIQSQQSLLQRLFDSQRYFIIATWLWQSVLTRFGGWQVPIIPILILYRIIFRKRLGADQIRSNYLLGLLLGGKFHWLSGHLCDHPSAS